MSVSTPNVMVSSTCYDLRDLRATLSSFIEQLGYTPLLSELPSFPVDPDATTVDNCRRRVEENADVLVLIIGGRYGFADSASSRSVTNLEYLAARSKRIPIYSFVRRELISVLPLWKANKAGDFSSVVDDIRVFEFIEQVRSTDGIWTLPFETPTDIQSSLKLQLAHLMKDSLVLRRKLLPVATAELQGLHGTALRLALERPEAWEYRLFFEIMAQQLDSKSDLERQHTLRIALGTAEDVPTDGLLDWFSARLAELRRLVDAINILFAAPLESAFGPQGVPGNVQEIRFVAKHIVDVYEHILNWSRRIRLLACSDDDLHEALSDFACITDKTVNNLRKFVEDGSRNLMATLKTGPNADGSPVRIMFTFEIELNDDHDTVTNRVFRELSRVTRS